MAQPVLAEAIEPILTVLTPEQRYLLAEEISVDKHELRGGKIVNMAGATPRHNDINSNIQASIQTQLRGKACRITSSDLRLYIPSTGDYTYPDLIVRCGKSEYRGISLLNPTLIVEVMSPATQEYDLGDKLNNYKSIPALQQVLFIAQDQAYAALHTRTEGNRWDEIRVEGEDAILTLASIECTLALAEVYEGVDEA